MHRHTPLIAALPGTQWWAHFNNDFVMACRRYMSRGKKKNNYNSPDLQLTFTTQLTIVTMMHADVGKVNSEINLVTQPDCRSSGWRRVGGGQGRQGGGGGEMHPGLHRQVREVGEAREPGRVVPQGQMPPHVQRLQPAAAAAAGPRVTHSQGLR